MSEDNWATLSSSTNTYQSTYEKSCCSKESVWNNQDFKGWQTESFNIAKTLYTGKAGGPNFICRHQRERSCASGIFGQKHSNHTVKDGPRRVSSLRANPLHLWPISLTAWFCWRARASQRVRPILRLRSCRGVGNYCSRRVTISQLRFQILTLLKAKH